MRRKNLILVMVSIISVLCLVGCGELESEPVDRETVNDDGHLDDSMNVYVDPDTGVNYLVFDGYYAGGMTVRYNADGTVMVTELENNN